MPLKRFWMMESIISRLQAEQDLRLLNVQSCSQSAEGTRSIGERLAGEMGTVVIRHAVLDREGLNRLKTLSR